MILYNTDVVVNSGFYKGVKGVVVERCFPSLYLVRTEDWRTTNRWWKEKDLDIVVAN
jgi:hypothetical protein